MPSPRLRECDDEDEDEEEDDRRERAMQARAACGRVKRTWRRLATGRPGAQCTNHFISHIWMAVAPVRQMTGGRYAVPIDRPELHLQPVPTAHYYRHQIIGSSQRDYLVPLNIELQSIRLVTGKFQYE